MAQLFVRAPRPTDLHRKIRAVAPLVSPFIALLISGCVSHEPQPIDVSRVLGDLESRRWESPAVRNQTADPKPDGTDARDLAAFAITHNLALTTARARIGVSDALLIEAGLLPDFEIGWDAMDVLAVEFDGGSAGDVEYLSGLGASIPLLRPGERDAKRGVAAWKLRSARRRVTAAEWLLTRDVYIACETVLEAENLLAQNLRLAEVAETTRDYFQRAKEAGAATAIQANLAIGDLLAIRAERVRLDGRLRTARHALNALLGVSPGTQISIIPAPAADELPRDASELARHAVELRPDLNVLIASYQAAEEAIRLEVARQFPQISIGTGLSLMAGFFSGFNRHAIATAIARRQLIGREVEAQVHEVRREVHDAFAAFQETRLEVEFLQASLLPNAEESLRLAGEALEAGEVTLLEILALQRSLVGARTRYTEARAELARRQWRLLAAGGRLLPGARSIDSQDIEQLPTEPR